MLRFNNSSRSHGLLVAIVIAAVGGVYSTACVAQEPAPAVVAAQAAATSAAGLATSSGFPYPIWKNRVFDDANNLAGVLLRTAQGPVQIKELKWFANQAGFINIGYLSAFNADGEPITFGSTDGCLEKVTKEAFLGTAMTQSDNDVIQSFDFVTNYEGYLAVGSPVIDQSPSSGPADTCSVRRVRECMPIGCNGHCGFANVAELSTTKGGVGPAADPDVQPFLQLPEDLECECYGTEGDCKVTWIEFCKGTCVSGSCEAWIGDNREHLCGCR